MAHSLQTCIMVSTAIIDLKIICNELSEVKHKLYQIGVQLGVPRHKLKEFEKEADPMAASLDYWLKGNVIEGVPISWKSVVNALCSGHVDERGLSNRISKKFCQQGSKKFL